MPTILKTVVAALLATCCPAYSGSAAPRTTGQAVPRGSVKNRLVGTWEGPDGALRIRWQFAANGTGYSMRSDSQRPDEKRSFTYRFVKPQVIEIKGVQGRQRLFLQPTKDGHLRFLLYPVVEYSETIMDFETIEFSRK